MARRPSACFACSASILWDLINGIAEGPSKNRNRDPKRTTDWLQPRALQCLTVLAPLSPPYITLFLPSRIPFSLTGHLRKPFCCNNKVKKKQTKTKKCCFWGSSLSVCLVCWNSSEWQILKREDRINSLKLDKKAKQQHHGSLRLLSPSLEQNYLILQTFLDFFRRQVTLSQHSRSTKKWRLPKTPVGQELMLAAMSD